MRNRSIVRLELIPNGRTDSCANPACQQQLQKLIQSGSLGGLPMSQWKHSMSSDGEGPCNIRPSTEFPLSAQLQYTEKWETASLRS
ncbi:unnamed protein product [Prunus armeniaca]|uniref:Uncharacterized protein n=1 Tax=Prunus armeniaca TaxID=36596 RepID=A0A6J5VF71_PRUAR|nr:unnamed protein product [Prunus armeniaca]